VEQKEQVSRVNWLTCVFMVGVTRFELVASSVSDGPGAVVGKHEM
jgi:hypothetical protein